MSLSCLIVVTCSKMAFCASEMVFCTARNAKNGMEANKMRPTYAVRWGSNVLETE